MRALAPALLGALLIVGCLEAPSDRAGSLGESTRGSAEPIVLHRWTECAPCGNGTASRERMFVAFDDAAAFLVDVAPGNASAPHERLDPIVRASGGGALDRVETATLAADVVAKLRETVTTRWPQGAPDGSCVERLCPATIGRPDNGTWEILEVVGLTQESAPLALALFEAEGAFQLPPAFVERPSPTPATMPEQGGVAWQGMDAELGSIRAPHEIEIRNGSHAGVSAQLVLREHYEAKDARYFLFAWSVENAPLDIAWKALVRADTGDDIPCERREDNATAFLRCFVGIRDMPPAGTEILMRATVGAASEGGTYEISSTLTVFSAQWERVTTSNGLDAQLLATTRVVAEGPQASSV